MYFYCYFSLDLFYTLGHIDIFWFPLMYSFLITLIYSLQTLRISIVSKAIQQSIVTVNVEIFALFLFSPFLHRALNVKKMGCE